MSVARPDIRLDNTTVVTMVIKNNSIIVEGVGVIVDTDQADVAVANSNSFGVAMASEGMVDGSITGDGVKTVQVALLGGVVKVKCSGTATKGLWAIAGTDGFENQTPGGGSTAKYLAGKFTQSGVDGEFVGLLLHPSTTGTA